MRRACTVAAAAAVITGFWLAPASAQASCDPQNPAGCLAAEGRFAGGISPALSEGDVCTLQAMKTGALLRFACVAAAILGEADAKAGDAIDSHGVSAKPQATAAAPLQLKRFTTRGPARRSVSRKSSHRVTRMPPPRPQQTAESSDTAVPTSAEASTASLTPKAIPTVSTPALAPAPERRTVGFAAATAIPSGEGALASAVEPAPLPPGVTIARFDQVNEIDLAADAETKEPAAASDRKSDRVSGVSLVTPANAASSPTASSGGTAPEAAKPSWLAWLYGKLVDGLLTAMLAIRSIFV